MTGSRHNLAPFCCAIRCSECLPRCAHLPHLLVQDGTSRSAVFCLENGGSENLRVAPTSKRLNFMQLSNAATGSERLGSTINLHFEGNWMPIRVSSWVAGWEGGR